jgi:hypothetical protein
MKFFSLKIKKRLLQIKTNAWNAAPARKIVLKERSASGRVWAVLQVSSMACFEVLNLPVIAQELKPIAVNKILYFSIDGNKNGLKSWSPAAK